MCRADVVVMWLCLMEDKEAEVKKSAEHVFEVLP